MTEYNAADRRAIRQALRLAKQVEAERGIVIAGLMSTPSGRAYVHELLVRCHIYNSSFSPSAIGMAFAEGERNIGLQILGDVMRCAPDQYTQMMREENDRTIAASRRLGDHQNANGRDRQPYSPTGSGSDTGTVDAEYDPYGYADGDSHDGSEDDTERGPAEG